MRERLDRLDRFCVMQYVSDKNWSMPCGGNNLFSVIGQAIRADRFERSFLVANGKRAFVRDRNYERSYVEIRHRISRKIVWKRDTRRVGNHRFPIAKR